MSRCRPHIDVWPSGALAVAVGFLGRELILVCSRGPRRPTCAVAEPRNCAHVTLTQETNTTRNNSATDRLLRPQISQSSPRGTRAMKLHAVRARHALGSTVRLNNYEQFQHEENA